MVEKTIKDYEWTGWNLSDIELFSEDEASNQFYFYFEANHWFLGIEKVKVYSNLEISKESLPAKHQFMNQMKSNP
ncbi:MAG: hypothetical protein ACRCXZ_07910 [Patescibacteria group bacterium]